MARKTPAESAKAKAIDRALRGMFRMVEARPLPEHISTVVDQLETAEQPVLKKSG